MKVTKTFREVLALNNAINSYVGKYGKNPHKLGNVLIRFTTKQLVPALEHISDLQNDVDLDYAVKDDNGYLVNKVAPLANQAKFAVLKEMNILKQEELNRLENSLNTHLAFADSQYAMTPEKEKARQRAHRELLNTGTYEFDTRILEVGDVPKDLGEEYKIHFEGLFIPETDEVVPPIPAEPSIAQMADYMGNLTSKADHHTEG